MVALFETRLMSLSLVLKDHLRVWKSLENVLLLILVSMKSLSELKMNALKVMFVIF